MSGGRMVEYEIIKQNKMSSNITILGSTGSIGTQTLDVVREYGDRFGVTALTARDNWELLARQAREFRPKRVVISNEAHLGELREAVADLGIEVRRRCRAPTLS